ncbi:MAG: tyrosine-type recombinase/integrase [Xanthobacteraceae bacterium]
MKLTKDAVRAQTLPAGKSEAIFFDDDLPGFGLRLRERGSRSFVFQYKLGAKQRRMALGAATALNLGAVRKTAEKLYARVKLGEDPASDKAEAQAKAVHTFKAAADVYLEQQRARLRERTYPDLERHLLKHAKTLHELQLGKIARSDIAAVITSVTKNSGQVTANRVRTSLSGFFTWAMEQGTVDTNPVIGTARHKEQSRDRVLTPAELRAIWNALGSDDFGTIIKLLALTGQRAAEIAGLRWSEIHDGAIVLPGDRTKNHRPHIVPLSDAAAAIVAEQPKRINRDLIFGRGVNPFSGWSNCKERLDARIAEAKAQIPHWTPHDLRRTFATYSGGGLPEHQLKKLPPREREAASGLEIEPHVIEAVLNHVSGHKSGVAGIYNRSTYARDKKVALDKWAERLIAIVEDRVSNITRLRREA